MAGTDSAHCAQRSLKLPVYCVGGVYLHHATKSGYGRLEEYLGQRWTPSRMLKVIGDTVLRIPGRLISWRCGLFEYSRQDFVNEFALWPFLWLKRGIWHFLYAEKQFLFSSCLPRLKNVYLVGTFHHHPVKFPYMVQRARHYRRLDLAVAMSTVQLEMLERIVGHGKAIFVPHGIDIEYWQPGPNRPIAPPWRLVFAGNHMRDFSVLEQVIEKVLRVRDDVEFVLISSEKACARIFRRKHVRWLFSIPDEQYRRQLQNAALLVLPLKYSTAVNTVLEALACGVPVVTTRGGISDYLSDDCSAQLEPGDANGMAQSIIALLDSPETIHVMGKAARRRAEEFAWPRVAAQLKALYAAHFGAN